ncbi:MAG TPA: metal ABC transporter substrate-binding protein, partial [Synechococcales bacterium UBA8647]|nr:metal ABC transporter substrate-binding protein [Synechococcales bacterium UBA8647]
MTAHRQHLARGKQLLIALLSSALMAGCTASPELEKTKQGNNKPVVLTTFTVLADMA